MKSPGVLGAQRPVRRLELFILMCFFLVVFSLFFDGPFSGLFDAVGSGSGSKWKGPHGCERWAAWAVEPSLVGSNTSGLGFVS